MPHIRGIIHVELNRFAVGCKPHEFEVIQFFDKGLSSFLLASLF
jgi:hypothetical protein